MKLVGPHSIEFWHILAAHIMCLCGLDLWPIHSKIRSRYQDGLLNIYAEFAFETYLRFWNMQPQNADFVPPLLGNQCCRGNHFMSHKLGGRVMLASKYEFDTITQCWVIALFNWIHFMTLWPWPLTFWPWSLVTWCNCVGIPCAKFEVDTTYRSELGWLEVSIA